MNSDILIIGKRTLKKEAIALSEFVDSLDESFESAAHQVFACQGTVLLTGMGKSGLVARKWASTLASTGTKAYFINPAEAQHGDLGILHREDILIALSYSGETEELNSILRHARQENIPIIAVTREGESSLTKQSTITLSISISEEACPLGLAPTTSTTLMMALGDALAATLMQMRRFTEKDFARLHPGGTLGRKLWLRVSEMMHTHHMLPLVEPEAEFEAVLLEMTSKRLGLAIVGHKENVEGIITDGDLRRYLQREDRKDKPTAKQMMKAKPHTISPKTLAVDALKTMEERKIQHLLVVENSRLLGVIHLHDLLKAKVV